MSAWRIEKIDAQTRALAEAAAKAAGLPVGIWLERAIMRRVSNPQLQSPVSVPTAPVELAAAAPSINADRISPEMKAALDAAERRRRARAGEPTPPPTLVAPGKEATVDSAGGGHVDIADPFAAPDATVEESPFESAVPLEPTPDESSPIRLLNLDHEQTGSVATGTDDDAGEQPWSADGDVDRTGSIVDVAESTLAPATSEAHTDDAPGEARRTRVSFVPSWEDDADSVTTTTREALAPAPPEAVRRRTPTAVPLLVVGVLVLAAGGGGAYFMLATPDTASPSTATATSAARPAAGAASTPAKPPEPTAARQQPSATAQAGTTTTAAAPPPPAPQPASATPAAPAPAASAPVAESAVPAQPPLPQPKGPSIANLAVVEQPASASAPMPPPVPAAAPAPAAATASDAGASNEALPLLRTRAEAGELDAQVELGRRYIQGIGVGRNDVEAGKWLLRAAEQGNAQAQFNVGVMYERGVGLEANLPKALEFYRKAAAQGTPMAMHNLALLHAAGAPGLPADPQQARKLMTQAAELGQLESQYSLSLMYLQGVGTPIDRIAAMSWLAIAARPNQPQLVEAAKQLSAQLNDAERARAQQMFEGHVRRISANLQKLPAKSPAAGAQRASVPIAAPAPQETRPPLPRVVDKAAISEMQKHMAALKIYNGAADGTVGPRTATAIREFQTMAGLPVDGKPSIALLESLREIADLTRQ